ncbi:MAG: helix-turn-helix domain-containing protein [Holophaga sp.]|nr:helix-turn-helix domain-containing protein [Holophaga sp.]
MPKLKTVSPAPAPAERPPVLRLSLSVDDASDATGLSKSYLYTCMKVGTLGFVKAGARRLIAVSELQAFLSRLPHGPEAA